MRNNAVGYFDAFLFLPRWKESPARLPRDRPLQRFDFILQSNKFSPDLRNVVRQLRPTGLDLRWLPL
jgi:hypothetical protein